MGKAVEHSSTCGVKWQTYVVLSAVHRGNTEQRRQCGKWVETEKLLGEQAPGPERQEVVWATKGKGHSRQKEHREQRNRDEEQCAGQSGFLPLKDFILQWERHNTLVS